MVPRAKEGRKGMREEGKRKEGRREGKKENDISKEKHQRLTPCVHGITVKRLRMDV